MDASQSWQPFVVIFYIFLSCSCMRLTGGFHRKKEMEPFYCCPLKIQLLVVEGKNPGFNMSTISSPRAKKDQRKHELASVIFYIKNSCYPFKTMGCLRLWTSCPADPSHRRGFRNKIAMKIRLMSKLFQTTLILLLGRIARMKNTGYWTSNTHLSPLTMGPWIKQLTVNNNVIYIVMSCFKSSFLLLNLLLQLLI